MVTVADYDDIHRRRDRFVVTPGHENVTIERVVKGTDTYLVVEKFGEAAAAAEAEEEREGTS